MYASRRVENLKAQWKWISKDVNLFLIGQVQHQPTMNQGEWFEWEHTCWHPKDGDLYLCRAKPEETLVEARSDTDVQIVRQIWV